MTHDHALPQAELAIPTARRGAIVLCGGRSSRMGSSKAWLPLASETLLQRVVRKVSAEVQLCVVVAAPGQELPPLPASVPIVRDRREGRGPLEGLAAALHAAGRLAEAWFVTSCDTPLIEPRLVRHLFDLLEQHESLDAVVPVDGEFLQALTAVYRPGILTHVEELLAAGQLRMRDLVRRLNTRRIGIDEFRSVDPALGSFFNLNTPDDYRRAVELAASSG